MRDAISMGVDIISMSWTIERTESNKEDIIKLETALNEAARKKILLFCAASDQGVSPDKSFPGREPSCFKIGAATEWGMPSEFTGASNNLIDYILPGQNITQGRNGKSRSHALTGSSVATAFASGLAALILRCVQFAAHHQSNSLDGQTDDDMEAKLLTLKTRDGMMNAFESFSPIQVHNTRYVEVCTIFSNVARDIGDQDPIRIQQTLVKIARRLVMDRQLQSS